MVRDQARDAQDLYDGRSSTYDCTWHPRFARHIVELAKVRPGEEVLDLACGTGLVTFPASSAIGSSGSVIGIDISSGMLAEAEIKKSAHSLENVTLYRHSVTNLDSLDALKKRKFDLITCASALVLLERPGQALKKWASYLKPGGRLVVDVTHPQNLTSGIVFEKVGQIIGRPLPWNRLNFQKPDDLQGAMEAAGLQHVEVKFLSQQDIDGTELLEDYIRPSLFSPKVLREHDIADAERIFDEQIDTIPMRNIASSAEVREKARAVFRSEWAKCANADGKVQEIDGVFVGIGRLPF